MRCEYRFAEIIGRCRAPPPVLSVSTYPGPQCMLPSAHSPCLWALCCVMYWPLSAHKPHCLVPGIRHHCPPVDVSLLLEHSVISSAVLMGKLRLHGKDKELVTEGKARSRSDMQWSSCVCGAGWGGGWGLPHLTQPVSKPGTHNGQSCMEFTDTEP